MNKKIANAYGAKKIILLLICTFTLSTAWAQTLPLPYEIINTSDYSDDEVYVGLVGKIDGTDVWIDMATGDINEMKLTDNTLQGPILNGNRGPGGAEPCGAMGRSPATHPALEVPAAPPPAVAPAALPTPPDPCEEAATPG